MTISASLTAPFWQNQEFLPKASSSVHFRCRFSSSSTAADAARRQQVAFTRRFGEIDFNIFGERWSVPGSPEIVVVSNVTEDGRSIGVDLLMWDNCTVQHRAHPGYDLPQRRLMHRTTMGGAIPF